MAIQIQFRRDTAANWTSNNPVLADGELGLETDTENHKIGDGVSTWSQLVYGGLQTYADLALTGIPTAPTAAEDTNTTQLATTAYVMRRTGTLEFSTRTYTDTEIATLAGTTTNQIETLADNTATSFTTVTDSISTVSDTVTALGTVVSGLETSTTAHYLDTTNVHGIADTSLLETTSGAQAKADAAETAANGYTDTSINALNTSAIEEGTNLYFTDERAQDAVGTNVGNGLAYNDLTSAISVATGSGIQFDVLGAVEIDSTVTTNTGTQTLTNKTISTVDNAITVVVADISDVTASAAELNVLDGVTASTAELNYVDGVTSAIQTQLDAKADLSGDTFTGVVNISDTTPSTSATTGALVIAGGLGTGDSAYIGGNLIIAGDFTVNGTTTTVNVTDLVITDPLIYIGEGNNANASDLGLIASFNDGTYQHAGFAKDASDGKWKLFSGVIPEPTTTIDFTGATYDTLKVGALETAGITATGTVELPATTSIGNVSATEIGYVDGVTSAIQTQLDAKAPIASPTFTGTVTVNGSGIAFTDGVQVKQGAPSLTAINQQTGAYTPVLTDRDKLVEIASATGVTVTIPSNASVAYPVGTSIDILQTSTGQVTIAPAAGVTVNATPGLKLRTQWSSATLFKRAADTWVVYGDLSA